MAVTFEYVGFVQEIEDTHTGITSYPSYNNPADYDDSEYLFNDNIYTESSIEGTFFVWKIKEGVPTPILSNFVGEWRYVGDATPVEAMPVVFTDNGQYVFIRMTMPHTPSRSKNQTLPVVPTRQIALTIRNLSTNTYDDKLLYLVAEHNIHIRQGSWYDKEESFASVDLGASTPNVFITPKVQSVTMLDEIGQEVVTDYVPKGVFTTFSLSTWAPGEFVYLRPGQLWAVDPTYSPVPLNALQMTISSHNSCIGRYKTGIGAAGQTVLVTANFPGDPHDVTPLEYDPANGGYIALAVPNEVWDVTYPVKVELSSATPSVVPYASGHFRVLYKVTNDSTNDTYYSHSESLSGRQAGEAVAHAGDFYVTALPMFTTPGTYTVEYIISSAHNTSFAEYNTSSDVITYKPSGQIIATGFEIDRTLTMFEGNAKFRLVNEPAYTGDPNQEPLIKDYMVIDIAGQVFSELDHPASFSIDYSTTHWSFSPPVELDIPLGDIEVKVSVFRRFRADHKAVLTTSSGQLGVPHIVEERGQPDDLFLFSFKEILSIPFVVSGELNADRGYIRTPMVIDRWTGKMRNYNRAHDVVGYYTEGLHHPEDNAPVSGLPVTAWLAVAEADTAAWMYDSNLTPDPVEQQRIRPLRKGEVLNQFGVYPGQWSSDKSVHGEGLSIVSSRLSDPVTTVGVGVYEPLSYNPINGGVWAADGFDELTYYQSYEGGVTSNSIEKHLQAMQSLTSSAPEVVSYTIMYGDFATIRGISQVMVDDANFFANNTIKTVIRGTGDSVLLELEVTTTLPSYTGETSVYIVLDTDTAPLMYNVKIEWV